MAKDDERIFEGEFEFEAEVPDVMFPQARAKGELPDKYGDLEVLEISLTDQDSGKAVTINEAPIVDAADKLARNWLAQDLQRDHGILVEAEVNTPTIGRLGQDNPVAADVVLRHRTDLSGGVTLLELIVSRAFEQRADDSENDASELCDQCRDDGYQDGSRSGYEDAERDCERKIEEIETFEDEYNECKDLLDKQTKLTEEANEDRIACLDMMSNMMSLITTNATIILGLEAKPDDEEDQWAIGIYGPAGDLLARAVSSDDPDGDDLEDMWKNLIHQADELEKENLDVWLQTGAPAKERKKIALGVQLTDKGGVVVRRRGPSTEALIASKKAALAEEGLEGLGALVRGVFRARPAGQQELPLTKERLIQVTKTVPKKQPDYVFGVGKAEFITISGYHYPGGRRGEPVLLEKNVKTLDEAEKMLRDINWAKNKELWVTWQGEGDAKPLKFDPRAPGMLRDRVIAAELLREKEQIWEDHAAEVRHFHVRVTEMANEAEQLRTAIRVAKTESNTLRIENMWLRKRLDFIGKVLGANPTISRTASKGVLPHPFTIVVIDRKGDELISSGGESALEAWNQMKAPIHEATFIREMEDENREGLLELDLVETLQRLSPGEARSASAKSSEPTPPPPPPPPPPSLEGVGLPACALGGLTEGQLRLFDDLGLPACSRGDRNSPCEIMKREGIGALREEDILSVLLDIEPPEAARIIREAGGLIGLAKAPLGRLLNMEGVTLELALRIKSAGEFCMRMERADFPSGVQVRTPEDLKPFLKTFRTRDRESFWVILMDAKNQVFDVREVCTGTVDACSLHPRDIFSPVIIEGATAFIIVHNHPSGQPSASPEDAMLSVRVRDAAKGLGLRMLDSLIVAGNEIVSLRAEGLI